MLTKKEKILDTDKKNIQFYFKNLIFLLETEVFEDRLFANSS